MPEPAPATQTDKQKAAEAKKKEAEKKKKEAEKAKAAKEKAKAAEAKKKEAEKKKAAAAKANEQKKAAAEKQRAQQAKANEEKRAEAAKAQAKAQAQRDKEAAERAKVAAQREAEKAKKEADAKAKEEKQLREYEKYIESQENPKTEVISYISLGLRAGYSALMDKIQATSEGTLWGAGTLNKSNAFQQLIGGGGAGLDLTYNLEYGHFLFETGLDFRFLNSTSKYGFNAVRQDLTYGAQYNYLFDDMRETRNMMQLGLPVMFGGQFGDFYFLVGAKIHYALNCPYSQKGKYDIVVDDPAFLEPYGMGIHELNGQTNQKIKFRQPDISAALEIGLDLDKWLQQQPKEVNPKDKKDKPKLKPGQRLPFGREHVHYRVSLFAEYSVLNANATAAAGSVEFIPADVLVQKSNTMLAMNGNSKLNNLFVGAKFTIQFEIPGKTARPVPPPPAYAMYKVVDALSEQPLKVAFVETRGTESGKIAMKEKQIGPKGFRQKHALGNFTATANAEGYYPKTEEFTIEKVGTTKDVTIAMQHRPVLHVRVVNKETGMIIPANVQILKKGEAEPAYSLATDTTENFVGQMLEEGPQYTIFIAQMGYDTIRMALTNIGDTMNIAMSPVKKGEVFIVRNLHFATNKTRILATSEGALNDLYAYMARNPKVRIRIIGHTDNVGKAAANQKLSEGRANAVMKELVERGIANDRIEAEGRGMKQPIDTNDTEEGRQNNRRVEIEIL
jgi:outer membrane protein OmpA-like peptidoglycan-associated protein